MSALTQLSAVFVDCADPVALAAFYQKATGWQLTDSTEEFAALDAGRGGPALAFARVADYRAPQWPEGAKHLHLDFTVADLDRAVAELLELGATRPEFQPGGDKWVVLTDPEGHPFCLVPAAS
ncbi:VOC family protein [Kitasatospora sp. NPDC059673]|uniref:VOC family protein n=1 Tax=Kitasatospora sp. NPDC059673 TaxID=3346901 RepID=UPI0036AACF5F